MSSGRYGCTYEQVKQMVRRGVIICCLSTTLAVGLTAVYDVQPAAAAPLTATTVRQDRRPDRERPVTTAQDGSSSGFSQNSSSSSTQARPRLVRR